MRETERQKRWAAGSIKIDDVNENIEEVAKEVEKV